MLVLLHWPDFGGRIVGSLDFDTSSKILPKKNSLVKVFLWFFFIFYEVPKYVAT